MIFIAILLALALERYFDCSHLRHWQWFEQYYRYISPHIKRFPAQVRLAAWIVPPVLLLGLVEMIVSSWLYGFPRLLLDFVVLLYCFGPENLWAQLFSCVQAFHQGDVTLVNDRVKLYFANSNIPADSAALHKTLLNTIFIEGNRRIFAVIFWFVILGPVGALLFRLTALTTQKGLAQPELAFVANRVYEILNWLPARLLGLLFALAGHFVNVLKHWNKYVLDGLNSNELIITECGIAALDFPADKPLLVNGSAEKEAIFLFDRILIIMLVICAGFILALS